MYKLNVYNSLAYSVIFENSDLYYVCNKEPIFDCKNNLIYIHNFKLDSIYASMAFISSVMQVIPITAKTIIYRSDYYKRLERKALHVFINEYRNCVFEFNYPKLSIKLL